MKRVRLRDSAVRARRRAPRETLSAGAPDPAAVARALGAFLAAGTWDARRAVLARERRALLTDAADRLLSRLIDDAQSSGHADRGPLVLLALQRALLREARAGGVATAWDVMQARARPFAPIVPAVPLVVPAPPVLRLLIARIDGLARRHEPAKQIALLDEALARVTAGEGDRVLGASLQARLATALLEASLDDRAANLERAITCYEDALRIFTQADFPAAYARTQSNLGRAYWWREAGDPCDNRERAIACHEEALRIFTSTAFPFEHARVRSDLGLAYAFRIAGTRRENVERAIACLALALRVRTPLDHPLEYAQTQGNLGLAYFRRIAESRRENLEHAIACFEETLAVFNCADCRYATADTQNHLGVAYAERMAGDPGKNLEQAVARFTAALGGLTLADFPIAYARTQNNLGQAYRRRMSGERRDNLESAAIACYQEALRVWTPDRYPAQHATAQASLGEAYVERLAGERGDNLERAIACYDEALRVWTLADFPESHALAQVLLGRAYHARVAGDRRANLARAAACFAEALRVYTLADTPIEYRDLQLDRAWLAYDAEAAQGPGPAGLHAAYRRAHAAFAAARQAQADLSWLEYDEQGHASLHGAGPDLREMYARDAWCLWRLGDLPGAAVALEAGRAHALAEAQAIVGAPLDAVCAVHAAAFRAARQGWHDARDQDDRATLRAARETFLAARSAIRAHCRPDFLPGEPTYREIARAAAHDQALVYLAATDRGGLAVVVPPARGAAGDADERAPRAIALPGLTRRAVEDWLVRRDAAGRILGGYQYAVRHRGAELLREWLAAACDERERARHLGVPLRDLAPLIPATMPTLRSALAEVVAAWRAEADLLSGGTAEQQDKARELRARLAHPLGAALGHDFLANDLGWFLQEAELEQLLDELQVAFVAELRRGLDALGLASREQPLAFVLCGRLGVLPIHAAWARHDEATGEPIPLLETCELTLQPSARALAAARRDLALLPPGGPILAIGDPRPTAAPPLVWASAEAEAIAILARRSGRMESQAVVGDEATLAYVDLALATLRGERRGAWVQVASHGHADPADPANCYLLLAHDERLSLARLRRRRLLDGARGFGASGCVTGLGDLETAPDELGSFAAGVLQAGAPCAVATLWSVSDRATFLLMLRFMEALLGAEAPSPAGALAAAIRWLRTAGQAQMDELARRQLKGLRPPPPTAAGEPVRDAVRGIDAPAAPGAGASHEGEPVPPTGAPPAPHRPRARPYAHPIYWAGVVIYGA